MNLIEIPDGKLIDSPGAYRISMKWYHQQCCIGPSFSSSGLRTIWSESPYHFWMRSDLNEHRLPEREESDALALGKAAHALLLGEDHFDSMFAYVPQDAPSRPTKTQVAAFKRTGEWSEAAAEGAAFWSDFDERHAGKTLLTYETVQKIQRMRDSLQSNPLALEVLSSALTEVSMVWQDEITGLWLKARIDVIPSSGADYADLKTFAPRTKSVKRAVHQAISDHEYPMQMALGQMGAKALFGHEATDCVLVMIQSTEPFCVVPVRLDQDALYWARCKLRHSIDTAARCLETGDWPQPVEGVLEYTMPDSHLHRLATMQADGLLPNLEN